MAENVIANKRSVTAANLCALVVLCAVLSACTVVKIADDKSARERRNENFDAKQYVSEIWSSKITPAYGSAAADIAVVLPAMQSDFHETAAKFGRQAAIDAPWTFSVRGEGVVKAVNTASRMGTITVEVSTAAGSFPIDIQAGPVLSGSALRDSQAFISFNDFSNQIAYAQVSSEMNRQALEAVKAPLASLKVGDRIQFAGAFTVASSTAPIRIMPVAIRSMP